LILGYCKLQEKQDVLLVQSEEQGSEEEISLTSSEEAAELRAQSADDILSSSTKSPITENTALANWDLRESIEITLTAQPEDTVMAEERLDIVITSNFFFKFYIKKKIHLNITFKTID